MATTPTSTEPKARAEEGAFTLAQRVTLFFITWLAYLLCRLIAPTLRYTVEIEAGGPPSSYVDPIIYVFWHRSVLPAIWWFRNRRIAVMTSSSFDGEYIARIIEKFGFEAVRGSSTRGGVRALLGMHKILERERGVAFTIDGPKGPAYVAKPGPVLLARNTGVPVLAFHIALEKAWVLNSWDRFMIPKPFSRAVLRVSRLIEVPRSAGSADLQQYHEVMQAALDRTRELAEARILADTGRNVGTGD